MNHLPAIRKTVTSVVGALLTWGTVVVTSDPTRITASEWLLAAGSLATALGVYAVRNEDTVDDRGQTGVWSVVAVLLCVVLVLIILGYR